MSENDMDFPDPSIVARILFEKKLIPGKTLNEAVNSQEFQLFKVIGQNKVISTDQIQQKFQSPSLSMMLSNLQADELIEQSSDYRWKISSKMTKMINDLVQELISDTEVSRGNQIEADARMEIAMKRSLYKRISDQLVGFQYLPPNYNVEDLFPIPELELLVIIYQNQPISTEKIDQLMHLEASLSLSLSNLQADGLIEQTTDYKWQIVPKINADIDLAKETIIETQEQEPEVEKKEYSLQDQSKFIEHIQLIKSLMDIQYFKDMTPKTILDTVEFEILNIIYSNSPISAEDIEKKLSKETLLSLQLSNLKADNLIQENNYRWELEQDFRTRVLKTKVDQKEVLEQIKLEETIQKPRKTVEISQEKIVETRHTINNRTTSQATLRQQQKPLSVSQLVASTLNKYGYVQSPDLPAAELKKIPEFEIFLIISQHQPISGEEIESKSSATSVSLTLSNLTADGLINQTNDYKYEIEETLASEIKKLGGWKIPFKEEPKTKSQIQKQGVSALVKESTPSVRQVIDVDLLKIACAKIGYIPDINISKQELMAIPEFEVLKIIGDHMPVSEEQIKNIAESVSPVHISRTLSKLEADDRIIRNDDGTCSYTSSFEDWIIEDMTKKQQEEKRKQEEKETEERRRREQAQDQLKAKFINLLMNEGVLPEGSDTKEIIQLKQIPEFEILWIISNSDGILENDIKEQVEYTSPVMVAPTLTKLQIKGRIEKYMDNKYALSPDLRGIM